MRKPTVAVIGANGNMGRRYKRIFEYLGHDVRPADIYGEQSVEVACSNADAIVIATPTPSHVELLTDLVRHNKPVLCEKPIATSSQQARRIYDLYLARAVPLQMVNQYACLNSEFSADVTEYDFYNTGSDGLAWDCINLIGLSRGHVILDNQSPIWKCTLNGKKLGLQDVSEAYVRMISNWIRFIGETDAVYAVAAHEKVERYMNETYV